MERTQKEYYLNEQMRAIQKELGEKDESKAEVQELEEKDIWKLYRGAYGNEPFIRIVKERSGIHRYPEPKILAGSNYCDIGFERDPHSNRLVVISALDNLMKGAAGQAVQAFNIAQGFDETTGLEFPGLHP